MTLQTIAMLLYGFPGGTELIVIAIVVLLLFGGRKIPEMMRGLGTGIKEFKKGVSDDDSGSNKELKGDESEKKEE